MTFKNGEEMYNLLCKGFDLYCPETESYVFIYNNLGSIAVYENISHEDALSLQQKMMETGEHYWGALLGPGGTIYDSTEYKEENPTAFENASDEALAWCGEMYCKSWIDTNDIQKIAV